MKIIIIFLALILLSKFSICQIWNTYFGDSLYSDGAPAAIYSLYKYKNKLYVGGAFQKVGEKQANGLAVSKNFLWDTLSCGPAGPANCVQNYNSNIFVGYQSINNICYFYDFPNGILNTKNVAGWNGSQWFALSNIYPNSEVMSLCEYNNSLYIGGRFNQIGSTWYGKIARYDGSYHQVGTQGLTLNGTSSVSDMIIFNNKLIVGGYFYADSLQNIATWNGSQWGKMGILFGYVSCLFVDTTYNEIYAGGWCFIPGDTVSLGGSLVKWNGSIWEKIGTCGINGEILSIVKYRESIYMTGGFDTINGQRIKSFAKWNGQTWDSVSGGPDGYYSYATTLAVYNDELILGGTIPIIDGQPAHGLARYYEPPDSACLYFAPAIYTDTDTFYLQNDTVSVAFYNNNSHANTWAWNFGDTGTDTAWCPVYVYNQPGTFTVNVNVTELWCNKSAQKTVVVLDTITSIADLRLTNADLRIFPNPASGSVTIEVTGAAGSQSSGQPPSGVRGSEGSSELRITNPHGKTVKTFPIKESNSKTEINTKGWAKGAYLFSLVVGGKVVKVEKLVIE